MNIKEWWGNRNIGKGSGRVLPLKTPPRRPNRPKPKLTQPDVNEKNPWLTDEGELLPGLAPPKPSQILRIDIHLHAEGKDV